MILFVALAHTTDHEAAFRAANIWPMTTYVRGWTWLAVHLSRTLAMGVPR